MKKRQQYTRVKKSKALVPFEHGFTNKLPINLSTSNQDKIQEMSFLRPTKPIFRVPAISQTIKEDGVIVMSRAENLSDVIKPNNHKGQTWDTNQRKWIKEVKSDNEKVIEEILTDKKAMTIIEGNAEYAEVVVIDNKEIPIVIEEKPKFKIDESLNDLYDILSFQRQADTKGESDFIQKYLNKIPNVTRDPFGNYHIRIGDAPVLWSCHTDTVHRSGTTPGYRQELWIDEQGLLTVRPTEVHRNGEVHKEFPNCLGADNATGIWIMLRMIAAEKEGLYIFHRKEESGGQGSKWIVKNTPELVKDIKYAIAFDRRNVKSIITFQGSRTCSDEFADSLAEQLGMGHLKDTGGSFTDTKSYMYLIPECTNISAGFYSEHSKDEALDTIYLKNLMERILVLDVTKLVTDKTRPPKEYVYTPPSNYQGHNSHYYEGWKKNNGKDKKDKQDTAVDLINDWDNFDGYDSSNTDFVSYVVRSRMANIVKYNADDVVTILLDLGVTEAKLRMLLKIQRDLGSG